jgi:hypothetical protein
VVFVLSVRNGGGAQTPACLVSSLIKKSLVKNEFMVTNSTSFYAEAFITDRRFFHDITVMMKQN